MGPLNSTSTYRQIIDATHKGLQNTFNYSSDSTSESSSLNLLSKIIFPFAILIFSAIAVTNKACSLFGRVNKDETPLKSKETTPSTKVSDPLAAKRIKELKDQYLLQLRNASESEENFYQTPIMMSPVDKPASTPQTQSDPTPLPPVPREGINVGLPNINDSGGFGNTCWLNSILKFISCGTEFDDMLTQKISAESTLAQTKFREMVSTLRTGKTPDGQIVKSIPEKMYKEFLKSLKELKNLDNQAPIIPRNQGIGYQQDAYEYIQAFGRAFQWQPLSDDPVINRMIDEQRNFPQQATIFKPANATRPDQRKLPTQHMSVACIPVCLPPALLYTPHIPLNISELTKEEDIREVLLNADDRHSGKYDWNVHKCFTFLPQTMILSINRSVTDLSLQALSSPSLFTRKVLNPLEVDDEGLISITEHTPVYEGNRIVNFIPNRICYYRIDTALTHLGSQANSGHYICEERSENGKTIRHSDNHIAPASSDSGFGTSGSLIRLKLVKEEPFSSVDPKKVKENTFEENLNLFEKSNSIESFSLDTLKELQKHFQQKVKLQTISNEHVNKVLPPIQGIRLLQKYQEHVDFLTAVIISIEYR